MDPDLRSRAALQRSITRAKQSSSAPKCNNGLSAQRTTSWLFLEPRPSSQVKAMSVSFLGLHVSCPPSLAIGVSAMAYVLTCFTAVAGSRHFMLKAARDSGAMRAVPSSKVISNAIDGDSEKTKGKTRRKVFLMKFAPVLAGLAPALLYISLPFRGWMLPSWLDVFALPGVTGREDWQTIGAGLGVANYALYAWSLWVIGRKGVFSGFEARERHKLVDDGPFAYVRHPIYTSVLLWPAIMSLSLWNVAPLLQYIGHVALIPKMPMEEALIEDEDVLGAKYTGYKKRVPYRIIPFVW